MEDNKKWSELLDEAFSTQEPSRQEPSPQSPALQEEQIQPPQRKRPLRPGSAACGPYSS